jgi:polysaccharide biosynthesis protein PslG
MVRAGWWLIGAMGTLVGCSASSSATPLPDAGSPPASDASMASRDAMSTRRDGSSTPKRDGGMGHTPEASTGSPDAPAHGPSASCTIITSSAGPIRDASGNVWTLATNDAGSLSVYENGAPAGFTTAVTELAYVNGVVSQENIDSDWWSWSGSTWVSESDPTTACSIVDAGTPTGDGSAVEIFYGVNEHPQWMEPSVMTQLVGYMTAAGIQAVRIDMSWYEIESAPGVWSGGNIPAFDAFIAAAAAANLEVLPILLDTPTWAAGAGSGGGGGSAHNPPTDLSETAVDGGPGSPSYNAYIAWVMDRWGVHGTSAEGTKWIKYWAVWNEPNGSWAWLEPAGTTSPYGAGNPDPVKYVWLLKGAYAQIKAIDPTALVLAPSVSGAECNDPSPTNPGSYPHPAAEAGAWYDWLNFIYSLGIKDYFDIFEVHYYGNSGITQSGVPDSYATDLSTILELHAQYTLPMMQKWGDGNKRVWITETGLPGYGDGGPGDVQTGAMQAQYLTDGFHYARTQMTNVDRMFWYEFSDSNTGSSDQNYFGLIGAWPGDGLANPWPEKPSYLAYKAIVK